MSFVFRSQANVALNLQPKTIETKNEMHESSSALATAGDEQNRENKMRKADDDSKMNASFASIQNDKMDVTAQNMDVETKASENSTNQVSKLAASIEMVQKKLSEQEKMDICSSEQPTESIESNEDDNDIGEIHIVSIRIDLIVVKRCFCMHFTMCPNPYENILYRQKIFLIRNIKSFLIKKKVVTGQMLGFYAAQIIIMLSVHSMCSNEVAFAICLHFDKFSFSKLNCLNFLSLFIEFK